MEPVKLRLSERINLLLLPMAAQLIQVGLFSLLVCLFFVGLGSVALNPKLISDWTSKPPVCMSWMGFSLPIDSTMFQVSLILATFSGLSFAALNITDESYRDVFLAPIVNEMELNLAARRIYRNF
ncbi:MAG: hypothetical protein Q4B08_04830 [Propionibacteriaceae bacterium]|nr:hypothetical protein [Propionibacteriaceae bacterium]